MKILLDETLGFTTELFPEVLIKKITGKGGRSLEENLTKKRAFIPQKFNAISVNMDEGIDQLRSYMNGSDELLYIYDPYVTNQGDIKRIRNWIYPNQKLFLVDGTKNRGYVFFLLTKLQESTYEDVMMSLRGVRQHFRITSDLHSHSPSRYLQLKNPSTKMYYLLGSEGTKKAIKGSKQELITKVIEYFPAETIYMASSKPVSVKESHVHTITLSDISLPVQSETIDIFI
ncbi:hypothetical protein [Robertmurraya sp. FSL R5-0851]|uniref:hypothetical protein n=1 Tax=Robertmurraya sp. FSL R5-0851 TaxID=2921584 RepID=UPI0030F7F855